MSRLSNAMHQQKLASWKQIIIDCRTSGLADAEYMRRHNINKSSFYYWLHLIREELLDEHPECLHPCKHPKKPAPALEAPASCAAASETLPAEVPFAEAAPVRQETAPSAVSQPTEFVAVRASMSLHERKLAVSCGPFRFDLTEGTPPSLLRKLADAWRGSP